MNLTELVDPERGEISASIFTAPDIYELELERVFGRCWLFLTHESTIPKPGDYVTAYMGEDQVVVVRQKDGAIAAFLNQCRHRGMRLCRADAGNARSFTCTYHGWTYDTRGNLASVPHERDGYLDELDKSQWGARRVPGLANYRGLLFANWDPDAESFESYLDDMAWYLDSLADRWERSEVIGTPTRWTIQCNWKFASEQFASDTYHAENSHISALIAQLPEGASMRDVKLNTAAPGAQFSGRHGHGAGFYLDEQPDFAEPGEATLNYLAESESRSIERIGELRTKRVRGHNTVFPNFSFLIGTNTIRVWHPRGPNEIEVWAWTLVDADAPEEAKDGWRVGALRTFSPAGIFEQDDGENWSEIQLVLRGHQARKTALNVTMGVGHSSRRDDLPGRIANVFSEEAARGFYRYWLELMTSESR
ncbi:aromatic ring-hydroxylating dioxygenase subunit alpha [Streptomyces sp. GbtcB6]|uniref:aromatic ring-hydroxylating dioxygenase subunit alpha n=1 Tax=Streptomyces sp. GbtcB6 TaxID=2824751 RepID=UPI001C306E6B|nr:aromatic ring-hydroxylating dioxygenase subunit alpha [Streptomyces sp. GbtcB6]